MLQTILVIEDDAALVTYLKNLLTANNYGVKTATSGTSGLSLLAKSTPDLVLLDLTLPDIDGQGVCMEIRKKNPSLPIIMVTAKTGISDKVQGLTGGADDYITKPFVSEELLARIKTRLRNKTSAKPTIKIADLTLNTETFEVTRGTKKITLTPQEFKLLEYMMNNKGIVLTRDMILNRIWMYSPDVESRVVDVYIGYLRKKIDTGYKKKLFHSIRGFGYTIKD
jgi:DNA-binding response OmpR family regulator